MIGDIARGDLARADHRCPALSQLCRLEFRASARRFWHRTHVVDCGNVAGIDPPSGHRRCPQVAVCHAYLVHVGQPLVLANPTWSVAMESHDLSRRWHLWPRWVLRHRICVHRKVGVAPSMFSDTLFSVQ